MKFLKISIPLIATSICAFGASPAPSEPSTTWVGGTTNWSDESNWSNGLPSESVSAIFNTMYAQGTKLNGDVYVNDLIFGDAFALGELGNYNFDIEKSLTVKGDLYYSNLRTATYGGIRFVSLNNSKFTIEGDATFEAKNLTDEQKQTYKSGTVDVQIGSAATNYPMFAEFNLNGDLNIIGTSSVSSNVKLAAETVNIGGIVNLSTKNSQFVIMRGSMNNPAYLTNQSWGGLSGIGKLYIESVDWNTAYSTAITANVTLKNTADQTYTGSVDIVNGSNGTYTGTGVINLTMDAANASATQTINLSGSKSFTTVSVKNGTLIYSAPAAAESLTVSGGTLLLSYSDTTQGDLAISGGSFGATMDGGNAKVKSLAYSGGKLVFATDGFYGGLPNSIAVEGKFSKETLEKIVIDFSGLDAESLIGVPAMTLITAGSFEGMSTSVDADEYFAAENLINAIADFAWNGNSLTVAFAQVPEPAAIAAVFGALALALAARRRGK